MNLLGTTSFVALAFVLVTAFLPLRKAYLSLMIAAPLTTVAVIGLGPNNILLYQLIWLVFTIKFLIEMVKTKTKVNLVLFPFLIITALTIPLSLFNGDTLVVNVNSQIDYVRFSDQQITQWMYLFIAITTAIETEAMLRGSFITLDEVLAFLDIGMSMVLAFALLQLVIPADIFTELLRNSVHSGYRGEGGRISSTFQEPSMLSLYLLPLVAMHMKRTISRPNLKSAILIIVSLVVCVLNNSSAAFLALLVAVLAVATTEFRGMSQKKTVQKRALEKKAFFLLSFLLIILVVALSGVFGDNIMHMFEKMNGEGVSGSERMEWITHTWEVFLSSPLIGVGWGTTRCAVFVCWLSELGIIGCSFIFIPLLILIERLWNGDSTSHELLVYIITACTLYIFVSSEIYYLTFWIIIGTAMYVSRKADLIDNGDKQPAISDNQLKTSNA